MSYANNNDEGLFSTSSEQSNSPLYYRERPHVRAVLRSIVRPTGILLIPIVLVICFQHIGSIIGQWIDTNPSYVAQRLDVARTSLRGWFSQLGDLTWIVALVIFLWTLLVIYLYIEAYFNWTHKFHTISKDYVIEAERRLLQGEQSMTIEAGIVVGASVRRTLFDKFFPACGSVTVQTIDLEGQGRKILFKDVKDPYRMRDVILKVKQEIQHP